MFRHSGIRVLFCFCLCAVFALLQPAWAQTPREHLPSGVLLEFSLERLKGSVEKSQQKNQRLLFENQTLRQGISDLRQEKRLFTSQIREMSEQSPGDGLDTPARFSELGDLSFRSKKTKELIRLFRQDVTDLNRKIEALDQQLSQVTASAQMRQWTKKKKESRKDLAGARKELEKVKKRNRKPAARMEQLLKTRARLSQQLQQMRRLGNGL